MTSLPPGELAGIATTIAAAAPLDLLPPGPGRRWTKVLDTAACEAWIIAWPPGAGLPMHHHRGAAGAIHVVRGRLHERHLVAGEPVSRVLDPRHPVTMGPDHVHEVTNVDVGEAVSVHVYSPPGFEPEFVR
jgi:hypothetical protein